jgi:hypothetical protein
LKEKANSIPGWGGGFVSKTLKAPAFGFNYFVSGASIPSYRSERVLGYITEPSYKTQVHKWSKTQFGHNDQKHPKYEAAYSANLKQFVLDVNYAGGVPVRHSHLTLAKSRVEIAREEI